MSEVWVGMDVSKESLDVAVRPTGEAWPEQNNKAGIKALTDRLKKLAPQRIVLEAIGGHEYELALMSTVCSRLPDTDSEFGPGIHSNYWQQVRRPIAKLDLLDLRTNDQPRIQHTSVRFLTFGVMGWSVAFKMDLWQDEGEYSRIFP